MQTWWKGVRGRQSVHLLMSFTIHTMFFPCKWMREVRYTEGPRAAEVLKFLWSEDFSLDFFPFILSLPKKRQRGRSVVKPWIKVPDPMGKEALVSRTWTSVDRVKPRLPPLSPYCRGRPLSPWTFPKVGSLSEYKLRNIAVHMHHHSVLESYNHRNMERFGE